MSSKTWVDYAREYRIRMHRHALPALRLARIAGSLETDDVQAGHLMKLARRKERREDRNLATLPMAV